MVGFEVKPCFDLSDVVIKTKLNSFSFSFSDFTITEINKNHKK